MPPPMQMRYIVSYDAASRSGLIGNIKGKGGEHIRTIQYQGDTKVCDIISKIEKETGNYIFFVQAYNELDLKKAYARLIQRVSKSWVKQLVKSNGDVEDEDVVPNGTPSHSDNGAVPNGTPSQSDDGEVPNGTPSQSDDGESTERNPSPE